MEKIQFHEKVYEGYLHIEKNNPERVFGINGTKKIEEVQQKILEKITDVKLELTSLTIEDEPENTLEEEFER